MIDKEYSVSYNTQQVEEIARQAARYAIAEALHPPNLDSWIGGVVVEASTGGDKMPRQRVHVRLPNGEMVWITGNTFSDLIQNALAKYGGGIKQQPGTDTTFMQYTDRIFDTFLRPRWKDTTTDTNRFLLDKHILPYFGEMHLDEISTTTIQQFFQTKSHLSRSYTKQMLMILHEILENAVEDEILDKDPTSSKRITLPDKSVKRNALSASDFSDIISHLPDLEHEDAVLLAMLCFTGMRRGEVLGLKWENVTDDTIRVRSEVTFKANTPVFHEYTKSKSGIRDLRIADELRPYLAQRGTGFVIGGGNDPITQSKFDRTWQRIGKKIDLHGATPHVFRHTYLSTLAASGVDPKTIQAIAGHADFNFTFNRYIHKSDENISLASEKFSEHLSELTQKLTDSDASNTSIINASGN